MPKFHETWTVLGNTPMEQLADNLWIVDGELSGMDLKRRMTVIRREDGALVIHNAIAMNDEDMAALEALGPVGLLVVPNGLHRLDAKVFHERYPEAKVACPRGAKAKVKEVVPVDLSYDQIEACDAVRFEHLAGTKGYEGTLIVRSGDGVTLVVNDAIFNLPKMTGLFGFVYGTLMGNAGKTKVTTITKLFLLKNKGEFKDHLLKLSDEEDLKRLIMSHGDVVREGASEVIRQVVNDL